MRSAEWETAVRGSAWAQRLQPGAGAVAALLQKGEVSLLALGRGVHAATLMEVGSVTKPFTALLLAEAVYRGEVELTGRLDQILFHEPWSGAPAASLLELATHTAGVPRLSVPAFVGLLGDPYRWFGERHLLRYVRRAKPRSPDQPVFGYSNLGYALLGLALARAAGKRYDTLLQERLLSPLGMGSSGLQLTGTTLVTPGYGLFGRRPRPWHSDAYAPCGALVSTAEDLLRAAKVFVERDGLLARTVALTTERRVKVPGGWIGLSWMQPEDGAYVWHNGGTFGYAAYLAFSSQAHAAVVLLANQRSARTITALGHTLMRKLTL